MTEKIERKSLNQLQCYDMGEVFRSLCNLANEYIYFIHSVKLGRMLLLA